MTIKRFADHEDGNKFWYELEDGTKIDSTDDMNLQIWYQWIESHNPNRYEEEGYLIFEFAEPLNFGEDLN